MHPRDEEIIVAAQQPDTTLRPPSTRRKGGTVCRCTASTGLCAIDEKGAAPTHTDHDEPRTHAGGGVPCVPGEFGAALGTLLDTLADQQAGSRSA
jgi:chitin synthase